MKNIINRAVALALFSLAFGVSLGHAQGNAGKSAPPDEAVPDVPDVIQVPAGEKVVLFARGAGSQIYTCQEGKDHVLAWILKGPDAELKDRNDKVIGQHFAGPSWKLKDGSEVTGKATAKVDALDTDSVPWLLVSVVNHSGNGLLSSVNFIQRLHTHGGQPPAEGCDKAHPEAETKSSYSADYYFYAPAK
jgi:hypothetical protein